MTSTLLDAQPLDAASLRALRHADTVIFRCHQGEGSIDAIKEARHTSDGFEQRIRIPVRFSLTDYSREHSWVSADEERGYTAFWSFMSAQFTPHAQTLLAHLRVGDMLTLRWVRGNATPALDEAHVVRDELHLQIDRGKRRETWLVAVSVGPDNTARMIRRA